MSIFSHMQPNHSDQKENKKNVHYLLSALCWCLFSANCVCPWTRSLYFWNRFLLQSESSCNFFLNFFCFIQDVLLAFFLCRPYFVWQNQIFSIDRSALHSICYLVVTLFSHRTCMVRNDSFSIFFKFRHQSSTWQQRKITTLAHTLFVATPFL